jgi:hypothetical protein
MPTLLLPTIIAVPAVALSIGGTMFVLQHRGSAYKPGFYAVLDATCAFAIILGVVGVTARYMLGSDSMVEREYTDSEEDDERDTKQKEGKRREKKDGAGCPSGGAQGDWTDFPDSDDERKRRKLRKGKIRWRSLHERIERRRELMNRSDKANVEVLEEHDGMS